MVFKITNSNKGTAARQDKCDTLWASGDVQTHTLAPAELRHCSNAAKYILAMHGSRGLSMCGCRSYFYGCIVQLLQESSLLLTSL